MNSLQVYKVKSTYSGFTLIELLLVFSLLVFLSVFISRTGISFYRSYVLENTTRDLVSALRQAQSLALAGSADRSHGVAIHSDKFILFTGDTFSLREVDNDIAFAYGPLIVITGPDEIHFTKFTGEPNIQSTIVISAAGRERFIKVTPSGNIDM